MFLDSAVVKLHSIWRNFASASVLSSLILLMVLFRSWEWSCSGGMMSSLPSLVGEWVDVMICWAPDPSWAVLTSVAWILLCCLIPLVSGTTSVR